MAILEKIERKFPWFGFPNLYLYMVTIFLVGLLIDIVNPYFYLRYLSLNGYMILRGEVWRLFTFIFYPLYSGYSILLSLLSIYIYFSISRSLTMMWGCFKFNFYLFIGYLAQVIGAFVLNAIYNSPSAILFPYYTTLSLIIAFALSFPDSYFMIYFLIPVKAKYFAYIEIFFFALIFLFSDIPVRISILCSFANVIVFFVLLKNKI